MQGEKSAMKVKAVKSIGCKNQEVINSDGTAVPSLWRVCREIQEVFYEMCIEACFIKGESRH